MDSKISQCSIVNVKDPNAPPKLMTFDGAYYTDSTTEAIYNEIAFPLVEVTGTANMENFNIWENFLLNLSNIF